VVGAGLFAQGTLLPVLKKIKGINLRGISTVTGTKARHTGEKYGFEYISSDYKEILFDKDIDLVLILTRHGSHAKLVCETLKAKKHVFVEKPLCLNENELNEIVDTINHELSAMPAPWNAEPIPMGSHQPVLMVGFNRRFSPYAQWIKEHF